MDLKPIVENFQIQGRFIESAPYGTGHINDTYAAYYKTDQGRVRYIHQRINNKIFRNVEGLMDNILRVTTHLKNKIVANGGDPDRETLNVVPARDGRPFYQTPEGHYWRTYVFIEGAQTYDLVEKPEHVENAARAFARFHKMLIDIPGERLVETIPGFHHTRKRFETFLKSLKKDIHNRAQDVKPEIDFVLSREKDTSVLVSLIEEGKVSEQIGHNDTKFNNVMIDDQTGQGICVIDLDTVMPGLFIGDFGESVRIMACTAVEDEQNLSKVNLDLDMFKRLARGYLGIMKDVLTPIEIDHLVFASKLLTFENGMRFLTDYLDGDVYFKIHRPSHNIDRCRTQLKMVAEIENNVNKMDKILRAYL